MLLLALGLFEFMGVNACPEPKGEEGYERNMDAVRDWLALPGGREPALSLVRPRLGLLPCGGIPAADELSSSSCD